MQDINLYHLLSFYAKKWPWILSLTILGAIAGFIYNTYIQVPLYKSDATLLLISSEDRKVGQDSTLINNYIQLIKSRRVLEPVIAEQGQSISYEELAGSTTATNEKNTEVIKISIASKDSETSKKLVDGVITSFKNEVKELYKLNNISTVDNASKASKPYNVSTWTLILVTSLAGFFLSLIALFFVYDLSLTKKPSTKRLNKASNITAKAKPAGKIKKSAVLKVSAKSPRVKPEVADAKPVPKKRVSKTTKIITRSATTKRKK